MAKKVVSLIIVFCLGALLVVDMPVHRSLSNYNNIFAGELAIAPKNRTVTNLRKASSPSSSSLPSDISPISPSVESISTKVATDKNTYTAELFTKELNRIFGRSKSRENTEAEPNRGNNDTPTPPLVESKAAIDKNISTAETNNLAPLNESKVEESARITNRIRWKSKYGSKETAIADTSKKITWKSKYGSKGTPSTQFLNATFTDKTTWNEHTYKAILAQGANDKVILVGDEEGYINTYGQLVVDVNETYLFWNDGQEKLCKLLQNMTLATFLNEENKSDIPSTVLNATMDCRFHNKHKQGFGQGNWVTAIYAARMAAFLAGVDFKFQCTDGQTSKMSLLLPWFDKYQVAKRINRTAWPHGGDRPTAKEACPEKYPFLRIDKMAYGIQDDLRKMAVSLVGTRDKIRQHPDIPVDTAPLIPDVKLDDVALHFRCGDVLGGARRNDFGMIRFNEYKKWIPNTTKSIGILTQPFEKERNRGKDIGRADSCRTVVHALVDYLQDFAPNAKISIHNGINETLPLAYARLVMANYSITSLSSFGIFPVVGTFGEGYFQRGNRGVNPFATYIPHILPNIHQMNAEVRGTGQMMGQSIENLVEWFVNDTFIV